jgi:hypothetical protein
MVTGGGGGVPVIWHEVSQNIAFCFEQSAVNKAMIHNHLSGLVINIQSYQYLVKHFVDINSGPVNIPVHIRSSSVLSFPD